MGAARIEIFAMGSRHHNYPELIRTQPLQVANETTSTTATTAGSRITVTAQPAYGKLFARVQVDEACYVAVGSDPTASNTALGWLLNANSPLTIPVSGGEKFSFKDLA